VARELGLDQSVLRRWVQQSTMSRSLPEMLSDTNGSMTSPVSDFRRQAEARLPAEAPAADQGDGTELSRLKRELEQLRHERDILIRALGHFTKSLG
jgi:transposase-like protein